MLSKSAKSQALKQVKAYRKREGTISHAKEVQQVKASLQYNPEFVQPHWTVQQPQWLYEGALIKVKGTKEIGLVIEVIRKLHDDDLTTRWYKKASDALNSAFDVKVMIDGKIQTYVWSDLASCV